MVYRHRSHTLWQLISWVTLLWRRFRREATIMGSTGCIIHLPMQKLPVSYNFRKKLLTTELKCHFRGKTLKEWLPPFSCSICMTWEVSIQFCVPCRKNICIKWSRGNRSDITIITSSDPLGAFVLLFLYSWALELLSCHRTQSSSHRTYEAVRVLSTTCSQAPGNKEEESSSERCNWSWSIEGWAGQE